MSTGTDWYSYTPPVTGPLADAFVANAAADAAKAGEQNPSTWQKNPVAYRPPSWGSADRQEHQIATMPNLFTGQTVGAMEFNNLDPISRNLVIQASRYYHVNVLGATGYNDTWAGNWYKSIVNSSMVPGAQPAWVTINNLLSGAGMDPGSTGPGGGGFYGGGGGGGTSSTVRLTNKQDAMVILNQAMASYLGRQARADELEKFLSLLNEQEMSNPTVATVEGDTVVQSGGFNPQAFAEEFAQGKEGSAEFQAATAFLDTFLSVSDNSTLVA